MEGGREGKERKEGNERREGEGRKEGEKGRGGKEEVMEVYAVFLYVMRKCIKVCGDARRARVREREEWSLSV